MKKSGVEVEAYTLHNGSFFSNMLLKEIEKVCQTLIIIIMRYQNGFLILSIHEQNGERQSKREILLKNNMIIMKKNYLNNATYIKSLLQEYPELKRLLELKN